MSITAQSVVNDARVLLNDIAGARWGNAEMLSWVNAGRRDMAALSPKVWGQLAKRTVTLLAGAYQSLMTLDGVSDAFALVDVMNNATAAGKASTVIKLASRSQLDNYRPGWRSETGTAVQNWFRDEANHFGFWVYPAVSGGKIDINVSVTPADLSALSEVIAPLDVLATTLMHYLLYRAYAKDAEVAQNAALSQNYLQLFMAGASASSGA